MKAKTKTPKRSSLAGRGFLTQEGRNQVRGTVQGLSKGFGSKPQEMDGKVETSKATDKYPGRKSLGHVFGTAISPSMIYRPQCQASNIVRVKKEVSPCNINTCIND